MYEIYLELLKKKGVKSADVCKATGIVPSTFSDWKKGKSAPKQDKLKKIADYFGVSVSYLMTGKESDIVDQPYYLSDEAKEMAQFMFENPEYKVLFDASRKVSKEDIETVKAILDKFRGADD
jgi:transcriptional regulator with XRE-family HTH domain